MAVMAALLFIPVALTLGMAYAKVLYEWYRKVSVWDAINYKENLHYLAKKNKGADKKAGALAGQNEKKEVTGFRQAPGPIPWPILGNLNLLAKHTSPFEAFTELSNKYGDAYSLTLGSTRCVVVNNLELIQDVLSRNGKYFGDRPDFLRYHRLFGGNRNNSLALCDWSTLQQRRRNLARRHCSPRDASSAFAKISEVGTLEMGELRKELSSRVNSGVELQLKPLLQSTSANMFCHYMCSRRFDYDDKDFLQMVKLFDDIFMYINIGHPVDFLPWLSPFYSGHLKKIASWSEFIRNFINERIIYDRERNITEEDGEEKDFTDAILKSLADDPDADRDTIMYMLEDFLGGHSAIGNLVMLVLGYVALNPEIAKKLYKEIDIASENGTKELTLMDKEKVPFAMATIMETLRYSSSPIVPHVANEDVVIGDYGITKGTVVFINNYKLNFSDLYWKNPEKFEPERFLNRSSPIDENNNSDKAEDSVKYTINSNITHFLPFGIGKRTCIGQNLVRSYGLLLLVTILQNYEVTCKDPAVIQKCMAPACVALPYDTYPLTLTPRNIK